MSDIAALVDRIDADPDKAHSESTPATQALIAIGEPALPRVVPLLLSDRYETRLRAVHVLELVSMGVFGFRSGLGWARREDEQAWKEFWGRMNPGPAGSVGRARTVELWQEWLAARGTSSEPARPTDRDRTDGSE